MGFRALGSLRLVAKIEGLGEHQMLGIRKRLAGGCQMLLSGVESTGTWNYSVVTCHTPEVTSSSHRGSHDPWEGSKGQAGTQLSQQGFCLTRAGPSLSLTGVLSGWGALCSWNEWLLGWWGPQNWIR